MERRRGFLKPGDRVRFIDKSELSPVHKKAIEGHQYFIVENEVNSNGCVTLKGMTYNTGRLLNFRENRFGRVLGAYSIF